MPHRRRHRMFRRILPSTDWAQGIGLLCFAAGYMSAGERPLTHNQLCDFVKQAAVGLSPIEGRRRAVSRRYVVLHYPYSGDYNAMVTRLGSCCYKRCCIWLLEKRIAVCASTGATTALDGRHSGEGASLAYWHSIRRCVKKPSGRKVSPLC